MTNELDPETKERWAHNQQVIDEFRANAGRVERYANSSLVLLHTKGAKTGEQRINPVSCLAKDGVLYICASKAGGPRNPDWYHNLRANPDVVVEFGTETFDARAAVLGREERDRIYAERAAAAANFAEYEKKTTRTIPVVALYRK